MDAQYAKWRRQEVRELAVANHGIVTVEGLKQLEIAPSTLHRWCENGSFVRLAPRAYLVADLLDDRSHLAAACASSPGAVVSHRAAARLWELDGVSQDLVEISVPRTATCKLGLVHRSTDLLVSDIVRVDGLPVTNPTRTLVDLGAVVDDDILERALESVLRRRLATVARLEWRLDQLARKGRPGPRALRRILARRPGAAPATESELETRFLQCLRQAHIPDPVRQHEITLAKGAMARFDFAYPELALAIELDGWQHHSGPDAFTRDRSRQNAAVLHGWTVLRFTWSALLADPAAVAASVAAARAQAA